MLSEKAYKNSGSVHENKPAVLRYEPFKNWRLRTEDLLFFKSGAERNEEYYFSVRCKKVPHRHIELTE